MQNNKLKKTIKINYLNNDDNKKSLEGNILEQYKKLSSEVSTIEQ
jgi:hypothetical protein